MDFSHVGSSGVDLQVDRVLASGDVVQYHIVQTHIVSAVTVGNTEGDILAKAGIVGQRVLEQRIIVADREFDGVQDFEGGRIRLVGHHTNFKNGRRSGCGRCLSGVERDLKSGKTDAGIHSWHNGDVGNTGPIIETQSVGCGMRG